MDGVQSLEALAMIAAKCGSEGSLPMSRLTARVSPTLSPIDAQRRTSFATVPLQAKACDHVTLKLLAPHGLQHLRPRSFSTRLVALQCTA